MQHTSVEVVIKKHLLFLFWLFPVLLRGQVPAATTLEGKFLTDTIDIGRPFQYSLTYRHPVFQDVLFPDTARHFAPYLVQKIVVFPTQTTGSGSKSISRDSAVYTLLSFETDSAQLLQVPVQILRQNDCTSVLTGIDTVFLRSTIGVAALDSGQRQGLRLRTETELAPLQQQFNYLALAVGILALGAAALVLYLLFGRVVSQQWKRYLLKQRHRRFLDEFSRLIGQINTQTAPALTNQAVILWKTYLERLDKQPYTSLTTPELAERLHDERVSNALRDADRIIYGGTFSAESIPALVLLSEVATTIYHQRETEVNGKRDTLTQLAEPASTP